MTQSHSHGSHDHDGSFARTRDAATDAARRTAESIESNPLAILVGGLAVGALAGALLPRSDKEKELLGSVGKRLNDGVHSAIETIREEGRNELHSRGFTQDAAREQVKNLLGGIGKAVSNAGGSALGAARGSDKQQGDR